jgi:hypothetical protein
MGKEIKEGGMKKVGWILFKVFYLVFNPLPRIIEGMNFVDPEGFLIKMVKPQGESNDETKNKDEPFLLLPSIQTFFHRRSIGQSIPFSSGDLGSSRNR